MPGDLDTSRLDYFRRQRELNTGIEKDKAGLLEEIKKVSGQLEQEQRTLLQIWQNSNRGLSQTSAQDWKNEILVLYREILAPLKSNSEKLKDRLHDEREKNLTDFLIRKITFAQTRLSINISDSEQVFRSIREFKEFLDKNWTDSGPT